MKILAFEKEVGPVQDEKFQPYLKQEALKVWELQQAGFIREIYFTKEDRSAVMMLECKDFEEAKKIIGSLPLVKEKLITFEIKQLLPYDGFKRLLGKN